MPMSDINTIPSLDCACTVLMNHRACSNFTSLFPSNILVQIIVYCLVNMTSLILDVHHLKRRERCNVFFIISSVNILCNVIFQKLVLEFGKHILVFLCFDCLGLKLSSHLIGKVYRQCSDFLCLLSDSKQKYYYWTFQRLLFLDCSWLTLRRMSSLIRF